MAIQKFNPMNAKVQNYPKETNLDLFRKEFGIMNVRQNADSMVYYLTNNRIAISAAERANNLIKKYGWNLTAKASKFPLDTLVVKLVDRYGEANETINSKCLDLPATQSNNFKPNEYSTFERLSEQLGVCHA